MNVLVLEDDPRRIRWLELMLPKAKVVWRHSVHHLLTTVAEQRCWDLVLLDCHLDNDSGIGGFDAAAGMSVIGPIVVWTCDRSGGRRMVRMLRERDQNVVGWLPFGSPELAGYIRSRR